MKSALDTSEDGDALSPARMIHYDTGGMTSYASPTARLEQQRQQQLNDRMRQILVRLNSDTNGRLSSQWNLPRRRMLAQKLLVSHTVSLSTCNNKSSSTK